MISRKAILLFSKPGINDDVLVACRQAKNGSRERKLHNRRALLVQPDRSETSLETGDIHDDKRRWRSPGETPRQTRRFLSRIVWSTTKLATLVGQKTMGNVLGSTTFNVGNGYNLYIPIFGWYSPNGNYTEGSGVEPDVLVEIDPEALAGGSDAQLNRALDFLQ